MGLKGIIAIGLCLLAHTVFGQDTCNYSISGKVLDVDTDTPLPFVEVRVKDTQKATITNIDGEFSITGLCSPNNTILCSCVGYCDTTCRAYHEHGKTHNVYLKTKVTELNSVVISAGKNRERGTVSIAQLTLDNKDLDLATTPTLASSLSQIQGVSFTSVGSNVQLPVIHGLYGNRILILNNGMKHGFQNWGSDHAPEIDISSANKITLVKGAAGVRFGPEALGGAIIVENNPLYLNEPFFLNLGAGYQTNGRGFNSSLSLGQGFEKFSYYLGGSWVKIGDRNTPDYVLTNSGKREQSFNTGLRYNWKKIDTKIIYSYVRQNLAVLRSSIASSGSSLVQAINSDKPNFIRPFSYDINQPNQQLEHHFGKAEISYWYTDEARLTLKVAEQINNRQEYDVRRNADLPIIDLSLFTNDVQLEWKHPKWIGLDGLIGVQWFTQNNYNNPGTGTTPFIPNYKTARYSVFITESLTQKKNTYELGVRLDNEYNSVIGRETNQDIFRDEFSFINLTGSVGYVREVSDAVTYRTNIGSSWRTPFMAELYSFGQHGFKSLYGLLRYHTDHEGNLRTNKVVELASSEISPEKGYKWLNEWEYTKEKTTVSITAYLNYIQNFIFSRPVAIIGTIRGPMPVFIFDQADALFAGSDITWRHNLHKRVEGKLGASLLWSKNIKKDESLINQPPFSIDYKLTYRQHTKGIIKGLTFALKPSYTFRQYLAPRAIHPQDIINGTEEIGVDSEIFDFKDAPEGYFLLNASGGFSIGSFQFNLDIQNALNTRYRDYLNEMRYFADELGFNIAFSINYKLNNKLK